jgi:competence protein ComEC
MKKSLFLPLLAGLLAAGTSFADETNKTLDVYWVDVEGGGATLIVTPENESVLIDTGFPGARDAGRIHHVAADIAGLKKIDHVILTHFHTDHFGGAAELAKLMPLGVLHDKGIPDHDPDGSPNPDSFIQEIKPYREMKVDERVIIKPDDLIKLKQAADAKVSRLTLRCLAVSQVFTKQVPNPAATNALCADATTHRKDTSDNANSVVMLLSLGPFRFFDGGDLTWNLEGQLVCPVNLAGQVDVYQTDHHGLDLSNNPLLVRSLAPTVSVMNNGAYKGGEAQSLATLKAAPSLQARYQVHRSVRGGTNNTANEFIANLEPNCAGNYIKMSVAPDGKSYTISIPATGHTHTYQTRQ